MMSLIDLDDDQRWVPTHVNVTVLSARGLRTKGKHGSRYLYTVIQLGREKYTTGLVEKAPVPEWNEECCFELPPGVLEEGGRGAYPPGSGDLVLTVMHRVLIGLDVFLGQTVIPLDKTFQDGMCPKEEWFKLNSKAGRKEKERGELQVTVQFTRNNMTASMFDLSVKDKPRSAFGKLKDRVTGRKRGDVESSSAIVPGRYAALSGNQGQPFGEDTGMVAESQRLELPEEKRSKVKDFFKGKLRKSPDTQSCSSLASESSVSSVTSDSLGPPPSLDLMSDPPSSPIYTSKVRVNPHYRDTDLAKQVLTSQHNTKVLTHKRAFSDEASKITTAFSKPNASAMESLKGQTLTQSKSSLCINGSHVYDSEPSTPKSSGAKLVLLEKCSPLSRSLQNLTRRGEDKGGYSESRRWSFDKLKKEEKEEEKVPSGSDQQVRTGDRPVQVAAPIVPAAVSPDKGRRLRLFSAGRSESIPAKSDTSQAGSSSEGRLRGWFSSGDSQNKPRLEVSPNVEITSDPPPALPPRSPTPPPVSPLSEDYGHISLHSPSSSSPHSTPLSPSNPFFQHIQHNPFFEVLVAEDSMNPFSPDSPLSHSTNLEATSIKRERPRPVSRQVSLPSSLPKAPAPDSLTQECRGGWDESFDAFASSRLSSPKGGFPSQLQSTSPCENNNTSTDTSNYTSEDPQVCREAPHHLPPLPPRRLLKPSLTEVFSDGWLHRGQELAIHKEAYLLSQTGVASLQRSREAEMKRNGVPAGAPKSGEGPGSHNVSLRTHTSMNTDTSCRERLGKYKPLEDDAPCWGGMLFEPDLYGHDFIQHHAQPKVDFLSLSKDESTDSGIKSDLTDNETPVYQMVPDSFCAQQEERVETDSCEASSLNNNISFSLTLGDLNMNLHNSDFGFIDSDESSPSELVETLNNNTSSEGTLLPEDIHQKNRTTGYAFLPEEANAITANTCFHGTAPFAKADLVSGENCGSEQNNSGLSWVKDEVIVSSEAQNVSSDSGCVTSGCGEEKGRGECDDNGNLQHKVATFNQTPPFSGVASARIKPKGMSRQNSSGSPSTQRANGEPEALSSLVRDSSETGKGGSFCRPEGQKNLRVINDIAFEDLHAQVAPSIQSKIGKSLSRSEPCSARPLSTLCPPADFPICRLEGAPPSAAHSPATDWLSARPTPPPEETQCARNLPLLQESRPHPVKPLTSSQSEKKEPRSVLEKLKSTISPGRCAQQLPAEPEKSQAEVLARAAQYEHLTNMELISLLLQQEMDMQKQQAAFDQQGAQLDKCEGELRKVRAQVRDLEDYIDNLLLRIMEQTPTLLQVRARHK